MPYTLTPDLYQDIFNGSQIDDEYENIYITNGGITIGPFFNGLYDSNGIIIGTSIHGDNVVRTNESLIKLVINTYKFNRCIIKELKV